MTDADEAQRRQIRVDLPAAAPASMPPAVSVPGVALITIDRPEALNALSFDLLRDLATALEALDADPGCRAVVLTGGGTRAFAAGADVRELVGQTTATLSAGDDFDAWGRIDAVGLPMIAAVRGFALGGGCELAMACDLLIAGDDAQFGQVEIKIGIIPGAGGTQRLTRAIGKARAMELILTGRSMGADEAYAAGLVTRVVPAAATVDAALEMAAVVASMPPLAVRAAKRVIRDAAELPLSHGLAAERQAFFALFDTDDQREGMTAFIEKRPASWSGH